MTIFPEDRYFDNNPRPRRPS